MIKIKADVDSLNQELDKYSEDLEKRVHSKLNMAGEFLQGKMVGKITSGLKPSLHPQTIARKKSTTPLIDKGELLNSIDHKTHKHFVEIGVFGIRAKIAQIHEFGTDITVTPKMRRYLHVIGIHLKSSTTHIHIPERSFMRSAFRENKRGIKKIMQK